MRRRKLLVTAAAAGPMAGGARGRRRRFLGRSRRGGAVGGAELRELLRVLLAAALGAGDGRFAGHDQLFVLGLAIVAKVFVNRHFQFLSGQRLLTSEIRKTKSENRKPLAPQRSVSTRHRIIAQKRLRPIPHCGTGRRYKTAEVKPLREILQALRAFRMTSTRQSAQAISLCYLSVTGDEGGPGLVVGCYWRRGCVAVAAVAGRRE